MCAFMEVYCGTRQGNLHRHATLASRQPLPQLASLQPVGGYTRASGREYGQPVHAVAGGVSSGRKGGDNMTLQEAFLIVIDLAAENIIHPLDDKEEYDRQNTAIELVGQYAQTKLGVPL